jgi:hypothetical protein
MLKTRPKTCHFLPLFEFVAGRENEVRNSACQIEVKRSDVSCVCSDARKKEWQVRAEKWQCESPRLFTNFGGRAEDANRGGVQQSKRGLNRSEQRERREERSDRSDAQIGDAMLTFARGDADQAIDVACGFGAGYLNRREDQRRALNAYRERNTVKYTKRTGELDVNKSSG